MNIFEKLYKFCPTCKENLKSKIIDNKKRLICSKCGFIFWSNPKPVVSALIVNNKEILMLQRNQKPLKGYWVLPGGFIEYEENPHQAIKREVEEETNLDVNIIKIIGAYLIDNDPRGHHIDIIYEVKTKNFSKIKISGENKQWKLFPFNELPKKIAYKHREAIRDCLKL